MLEFAAFKGTEWFLRQIAIFEPTRNIPLRFRKAGRVWCGGAQNTREPRVTIERTVSKKETTQNVPAFQDISGI